MRKSRERRIPMQLPVRVWGMDSTGKMFDIETQTLNITPVGARLVGMWVPLLRGSVVGVQCGRSSARFRISWVGAKGSLFEGQIGIQCMEAGKYIWGVALRRSLDQEYAPAPAEAQPAIGD